MIDPLFWLGLSLLLVSFSLFAVLLVTIPTRRINTQRHVSKATKRHPPIRKAAGEMVSQHREKRR